MEKQNKTNALKEEEKDILNALKNYRGTENYNQIPFSKYVYTDGINALIELCECWWLISDLGIEINALTRLQKPFILVNIKVNEDKSALITMKEDNGLKPFYQKKISYTDFKLNEYGFYICDNVMLLKSEY